MNKAKKERRCSRFRCPERKGYFCCADCTSKPLCTTACQNDPVRCGLEDRRPA